jgi:uncharacterized membrane protein
VEELLVTFAHNASMLVEAAAVVVVAFGSIEAFIRLLRVVATPGTTHGERKAIWRRYGVWLLLGLEFELAADIISSVVSPTWQDLGELGAIAVIRTFLNYFLERDLEHAEHAGAERDVPLQVDMRVPEVMSDRAAREASKPMGS